MKAVKLHCLIKTRKVYHLMNIGIVLAGGMAKGAYQLGALNMIQQYIPIEHIKYFSCASIGTLNGYAFASNTLDEAKHMWLDLCPHGSRRFVGHLLTDTLLQKKIEYLGKKELCYAKHFYTPLFSLDNRNFKYANLTSNNINRTIHLKASVAMPFYNKSVKIGNHYYYDGAMIDNIPVIPLMKHNLDYIICIYFDNVCYKFENKYFDNKIIKIVFPGNGCVSESVFFTHSNVVKMMDEGKKKTDMILSYIMREGFENTEYIYNSLEYFNSKWQERPRISGDLLVTNINKVAAKLVKRELVR